MTLPSQRNLFEVPEEVAYLNCAYMSPQLRSVREAGERALAGKSSPWEITPDHFFREPETSRDLFVRIIGGEPEGVAIIPSASYGLAVAAANVHVENGEEILVLGDQFPSNVYPWRELAKSTGADLVTVTRPEDHDWTEAVVGSITNDTAVVAVPNCHWTDGSLVDLRRVGGRCREVGAALVVDATQSLGAYPLDVSEVRPDFLVCAAYKWLLGPYSLGFMYVGPEYREGAPIEHNWINREQSEDFARLVEYREGFQPGARRYDVGEHSNLVLLPMANEAMRQLLAWGVEEVAESIGALTALVGERAAKLGLETIPDNLRAPHMTGLKIGPDTPGDLSQRLSANNVFVSVRGESLRVSPHLYNTEQDVDRLFEAIAEAL